MNMLVNMAIYFESVPLQDKRNRTWIACKSKATRGLHQYQLIIQQLEANQLFNSTSKVYVWQYSRNEYPLTIYYRDNILHTYIHTYSTVHTYSG